VVDEATDEAGSWAIMVGMSADVPDYVTHYAIPGRAPFLNLSDLPENAVDSVLADLARERADGASSRIFGRSYMELRRLTEEKLSRLFVAGGGRPERSAPHYFVLGASRWYRGLAPDMDEVVLTLAELPDDQTTFTYPDSFTAMGLGAAFGLHLEPRPYHGRVFRLHELAGVVERYGLPVDEPGHYEGYQFRSFEQYIEIQLWSDAPIRARRRL
jgi:hypothetical protein